MSYTCTVCSLSFATRVATAKNHIPVPTDIRVSEVCRCSGAQLVFKWSCRKQEEAATATGCKACGKVNCRTGASDTDTGIHMEGNGLHRDVLMRADES